ncbi:MAG: hypothetical protein VB878_24565 [Pirellulaceae bacterium]
MWVQFHSGGKRWATFEATFTPNKMSGFLVALQAPEMLSVLVATVLCLVAFHLYLSVVLRKLNPSNAVPKRVRDALNTLSEGLVIMDTRERVVLENRAFEERLGIDE